MRRIGMLPKLLWRWRQCRTDTYLQSWMSMYFLGYMGPLSKGIINFHYLLKYTKYSVKQICSEQLWCKKAKTTWIIESASYARMKQHAARDLYFWLRKHRFLQFSWVLRQKRTFFNLNCKWFNLNQLKLCYLCSSTSLRIQLSLPAPRSSPLGTFCQKRS